MPIDPSIPLSVKPPQFLSPLDLIQAQSAVTRNKLLDIQLQQGAQEQADRSVTRSALSAPGGIDAQGNPTPQVLRQIAASGSPKAYEDMLGIAARADERRQLAKEHQAKILDLYGKQLLNGETVAMSTYEQIKDKTGNESLARDAATTAWNKQLDQWKGNGGVPPDVLSNAPRAFDPDVFSGLVTNHQDYMAQKKLAATQAFQSEQADKRMTAASERTDKTIAAASDRQTAALSAMGARQDKSLAAILSRGEGKPLSDVGKVNADLEAGRITQEQADAAIGAKTGGNAVVKEDQRRLDKLATQYQMPAYSLGARTADRAQQQLTDPNQGYQSVTPEQARALVSQAKAMMNNYRQRVGDSKYSDEQYNRMNSLVDRVGKYVGTIGEGEKILAKNEMLNLATEMKNLYADRNADLLRSELAVTQSTAKKGGKPSSLTLSGRVEDAVASGRAKKVTVDGKDYIVFGEKGRKVTPDDMFELP